jgi:hypothetical protein
MLAIYQFRRETALQVAAMAAVAVVSVGVAYYKVRGYA